MSIYRLHTQIRKILKKAGSKKKLFLAMGSDYNVRLMSDYLNCYDVKFAAKLDNNPKVQGKFLEGFPIISPEKALIPFKDNAIILVFSPQYHMQMERQLEELGYVKNRHFFVIDDFRTEEPFRDIFSQRVREVKNGEKIYNHLIKKYGENVHIFLIRGATGDVYLNGLFLKCYMEKSGISEYVLAGDAKGLKAILSLFGLDKTVPLTYEKTEYLQQYCKFANPSNVKHLFLWQYSLYLNRCRIRMRPPFTFEDTYIYYIYENKVSLAETCLPDFYPLNNELRAEYERIGIKPGRTIIVAPFAYSVDNLPIWFWQEIFEALKAKGYIVFVNIDENSEINPFVNADSIFFRFSEAEALLSYSGFFLALRSGLCDIVSSIKCSQVILYPEVPEPLNLNVHRSDAEFSSLKEFTNNKKLIEISSPAIFDITNDSRPDERELYLEYASLKQRILDQYEDLN